MCVESQSCLMPDFFRLLQEARKTWNYFFTDRLVYGLEIFDCDHDLAVTEQNIELGHWLELHLRLAGHSEKEFCIILEFLSPDRLRGFARESKLGDGFAQRDVTMFVNIPKGVEYPEVVQMVGLPLVVWLQTPNDCNGIFWYPESCSDHRNLSVNGILSENGKTDSRRGDSATSSGQLPSQMVERGPQTTDKIASDQCSSDDIQERWAQLNDVLSTFNIVMEGGAIGFRFSRRFYELTQGIKVYLRPNSLVEYAANW